jgi:ribosomal protein L23
MFSIIETEKAFTLNQKNVVVLAASTAKPSKLNKVMLKQMLAKAGVKVNKISVVNTPTKTKRRGKNFHYVKVSRPKKFYLYLEEGQSFSETELQTLNQSLA